MDKIIITGALLLIVGFQIQISAQSTHPFPAAPVFSDLLSGVRLETGGRFKPSSMFAYFMTGKKGTMKVLLNGSEIAEFSFRSDIYTVPKYEIDGFELIKGKNDALGFKLKQSGKYELAYYIGGVKFYSFPFDLKVGAADPYSPKKLILLNGAWNKYAYLSKSSKEAHGKWEFRVFARSNDGSLKQTKAWVRVIRDSDKKVVAIARNNFRREATWRKQTFTLKKPGKLNPKINEYYSNKDFLANRDKFTDGGYTINLYMDKALYGAYKFTVKGGKIQYQGNQLRESTDPKLFIEGGGKEIWVEKQ